MKVFVCNDHDGYWGVGTASVITAEGKAEAQRMLDDELVKIKLKPFKECPYTLKEISIDSKNVYILRDGAY